MLESINSFVYLCIFTSDVTGLTRRLIRLIRVAQVKPFIQSYLTCRVVSVSSFSLSINFGIFGLDFIDITIVVSVSEEPLARIWFRVNIFGDRIHSKRRRRAIIRFLCAEEHWWRRFTNKHFQRYSTVNDALKWMSIRTTQRHGQIIWRVAQCTDASLQRMN